MVERSQPEIILVRNRVTQNHRLLYYSNLWQNAINLQLINLYFGETGDILVNDALQPISDDLFLSGWTQGGPANLGGPGL